MKANKQTNGVNSRIEYIVLNRPEQTAKLLYDQGYEPPETPEELVLGVKQLIREQGRKAVELLLEIHPDKRALESLQEKAPEDNFCGACNSNNYVSENNYCGSCGHSHYDGQDPDSFIQQFKSMSIRELERYYDRLIQKANFHPDDDKLAKEVHLVWNELRHRIEKESTPKEETPSKASMLPFEITTSQLLVGSALFLLGALMGSSGSFKQVLGNG